jgi:hypothetical protein
MNGFHCVSYPTTHPYAPLFIKIFEKNRLCPAARSPKVLKNADFAAAG